MPFKKLQVVLPEGAAVKLENITDIEPLACWTMMSNEKQRVMSLLLREEHTQTVMDELHKKFAYIEGFSVAQQSVEAVLPRVDVTDKKSEEDNGASSKLNRESLYTSVSQGISSVPLYIALTFLSSLVAGIGLMNNDTAVIIGAMVIAPLLGPNVALALATTLADTSLAIRSGIMIGQGILLALVVAIGLGMFIEFDFTTRAIQSRTEISGSALVLALASGCAGILALTRGLPSAIIGVMVAVALMPPLVTSGMLLGAGEIQLGTRALLLTIANIICVNLAGVITFWFQGVRPRSWWREGKARKRAIMAGLIWSSFLLLLMLLIYLNWV